MKTSQQQTETKRGNTFSDVVHSWADNLSGIKLGALAAVLLSSQTAGSADASVVASIGDGSSVSRDFNPSAARVLSPYVMQITGAKAYYEPRAWNFTPRETSGDIITGQGPLPLGSSLGKNEFAKNWPLQKVQGLKYTENGIEIKANGVTLPFIAKPSANQAPGYWTIKQSSPLQPFDTIESLQSDRIEVVFKRSGLSQQHVTMGVEILHPIGKLIPRSQAQEQTLEVPVARMSPKMKDYFLRSEMFCDFKREELRAALEPLGLLKKANESRDEFVLRVVGFVTDKMSYVGAFDNKDFQPLHVLNNRGKTSCNGLTSWFNGVMRVNDIESGTVHGYNVGGYSHGEAWYLSDSGSVYYVAMSNAADARAQNDKRPASEFVFLGTGLIVSEYDVGNRNVYNGAGYISPGRGGGIKFWDGPAMADRPIFPREEGGGNIPIPSQRKEWDVPLEKFEQIVAWSKANQNSESNGSSGGGR